MQIDMTREMVDELIEILDYVDTEIYLVNAAYWILTAACHEDDADKAYKKAIEFIKKREKLDYKEAEQSGK